MSLKKMALLVAVLMGFSAPAFAVAPILKLLQGPTTGSCGVTVRVMVDPQNNIIDVSQFTIRYKSTCMTFNSAVLGTNAPASSSVDTNEPAPTADFPICGAPFCTTCSTTFDKHVVVLVAPPAGQTYTGTGDKEIAILNFTATTPGTSCTIEWDQSNPPGLKPTYVHAAVDLFGTSLAFIPNAVNGAACAGLPIVVPSPSVTGTVNYYAPLPFPQPNFVPNVSVALVPPAVPAVGTTNSSGQYSVVGAVSGTNVTATPTKSPEPGDPSSIGGGDINKLILALAALVTLTPDQQIAADVDLSGVPPNSTDLQKLRRYVVFDFASCPNCATWRFNCLPGDTQSPCNIPVVGCTPTVLNLKGIFRGDVDSSWPSRAKPSAPTLGTVVFGTPVWEGDLLRLPVLTNQDPTGLSSSVFTLNYDPAQLEFVSAEPGANTARFELTVNAAQPGLVHGLLTGGLEPDAASGEILAVHFRARNKGSAHVSFSRLFLNDHSATTLPEIEIARGSGTATLPKTFAMKAAPNPFNPTTRVDYSIPGSNGSVPVSLQVCDLSGRVIRELVRTTQPSGSYHAVWDGRDGSGETLASGVYMIHLRAGDWRSSQKVILLK